MTGTRIEEIISISFHVPVILNSRRCKDRKVERDRSVINALELPINDRTKIVNQAAEHFLAFHTNGNSVNKVHQL